MLLEQQLLKHYAIITTTTIIISPPWPLYCHPLQTCLPTRPASLLAHFLVPVAVPLRARPATSPRCAASRQPQTGPACAASEPTASVSLTQSRSASEQSSIRECFPSLFLFLFLFLLPYMLFLFTVITNSPTNSHKDLQTQVNALTEEINRQRQLIDKLKANATSSPDLQSSSTGPASYHRVSESQLASQLASPTLSRPSANLAAANSHHHHHHHHHFDNNNNRSAITPPSANRANIASLINSPGGK